jgi:thymidylate synthase
MRFGIVKHSQYGISQRELLNITSVVTNEIHDTPHLPEFLPVTLKALQEYLPRITSGENDGDHSYTYGNRLRAYFDRDQIEMMINQLRKAPHTRRAIATLWDPRTDPERDTPPCLTQVVANIADDRLFISYTARSQDIYAAWPLNTFGILSIQYQIASELGLSPGPLTSHTVSAHIYEHDWQLASEIIQARQKDHRTLVFDPHGNFEIRLEAGQILISLIDPSGQNILWQSHGTNALELGYEIAALRLASEPAHFIYLGRELQRAQDALENHHAYVQDRA